MSACEKEKAMSGLESGAEGMSRRRRGNQEIAYAERVISEARKSVRKARRRTKKNKVRVEKEGKFVSVKAARSISKQGD